MRHASIIDYASSHCSLAKPFGSSRRNHQSIDFQITCNTVSSNLLFKMALTSKLFAILLLAISALSAHAFVASNHATTLTQVPSATGQTSKTALSERQWNFNEGQSPWGLKKNAEVWNGRVSQVCLTCPIF